MNFDHSKALLVMGLRSAGVTDRNVMAAIESVPRELFVPPVFVIMPMLTLPCPLAMNKRLVSPAS